VVPTLIAQKWFMPTLKPSASDTAPAEEAGNV